MRLELVVDPAEDGDHVGRQLRSRPLADLTGNVVNPVDPSFEVAVLVLGECPDRLRLANLGDHGRILVRTAVWVVA